MAPSDHQRRIRFWLAVFIVGLVLSGITAFPLESELRAVDTILHTPALHQIAEPTHLLSWIDRVHQALADTHRSRSSLYAPCFEVCVKNAPP
jgi:hypothetical protein